MCNCAPDGEITITRTYAFTSLISIQSASLVSSPNYITLVREREGTNTEVGMDFMTNVGPLEYCSLRKNPLRGPSLLQPMVLPLIVFVVYLGRQMFHPSGYIHSLEGDTMHFLAILARPSLLSGSIISGSMGGSYIPVATHPHWLPLGSPWPPPWRWQAMKHTLLIWVPLTPIIQYQLYGY